MVPALHRPHHSRLDGDFNRPRPRHRHAVKKRLRGHRCARAQSCLAQTAVYKAPTQKTPQWDEQLPRYCDGTRTPSGDMRLCRLCMLPPVLRDMVVVRTAPVSSNSMKVIASRPLYTLTSDTPLLPTTAALFVMSSKLKRMLKSVALGPSKS